MRCVLIACAAGLVSQQTEHIVRADGSARVRADDALDEEPQQHRLAGTVSRLNGALSWGPLGWARNLAWNLGGRYGVSWLSAILERLGWSCGDQQQWLAYWGFPGWLDEICEVVALTADEAEAQFQATLARLDDEDCEEDCELDYSWLESLIAGHLAWLAALQAEGGETKLPLDDLRQVLQHPRIRALVVEAPDVAPLLRQWRADVPDPLAAADELDFESGLAPGAGSDSEQLPPTSQRASLSDSDPADSGPGSGSEPTDLLQPVVGPRSGHTSDSDLSTELGDAVRPAPGSPHRRPPSRPGTPTRDVEPNSEPEHTGEIVDETLSDVETEMEDLEEKLQGLNGADAGEVLQAHGFEVDLSAEPDAEEGDAQGLVARRMAFFSGLAGTLKNRVNCQAGKGPCMVRLKQRGGSLRLVQCTAYLTASNVCPCNTKYNDGTHDQGKAACCGHGCPKQRIMQGDGRLDY